MNYEEKGRMVTNDLVTNATDRSLKQADIAIMYYFALSTPCVDWPLVNRAILMRYRPSGLVRIKKMAWEMAMKKRYPIVIGNR